MDIEYYEKLMTSIQEAKLINERLKNLKEGKLKEGEIVISNILNKYEL